MAVPLKGEQYKMLTVMRSIALLDGKFGQVRRGATLCDVNLQTCIQAAMRSQKAPKPARLAPSTVLSVKRRVGYNTTETEAEEDGARDKRQHMDVDDVTTPLVKRFTTQM